jgi:hypothetical protein
MIAGQFAALAHGQNAKGERKSAVLIDEAATLMNVGKDAVKDARTVLTSAVAGSSYRCAEMALMPAASVTGIVRPTGRTHSIRNAMLCETQAALRVFCFPPVGSIVCVTPCCARYAASPSRDGVTGSGPAAICAA